VDALDRHCAWLAHRAVDDRDDDAITSIHRIACFGGVGIEVGEPLAKELAHTVVPSEQLLVGPRRVSTQVPLNVRPTSDA
jgi:hypothetical protein